MSNFNFKKDKLDVEGFSFNAKNSGIVKEYRKQKEHLKNLPKEIETPTMFEEITQMLLLPKKISETDTRIVFHCEVCQMATSVPKEVEVKEVGLKCPICFPSRKKKNEKKD